MCIKYGRAGGCTPETYQPAPNVFVVPTMRDMTLYNLHANICKALANPIRIEIIDVLNDKELTFCGAWHTRWHRRERSVCPATGLLRNGSDKKYSGLSIRIRISKIFSTN
jgi:DNA-binding transcriptional ArsR family regulator